MDQNLPSNDKDKDEIKSVTPNPDDYAYEKTHTSVGGWFINLFKGYWYGLTDLFLASWVNVVVLALMAIVPLLYGLISVLAYWNPANNMGKMAIAVFDADRTFIKVQQLDTKDANGDPSKYTYRVGALDGIYNPENGNVTPISQDEINTFMSNGTIPEQITNGNNVELHLNNGYVVKYDSSVQLTAMNSWDTLKNTQLIKSSPDKLDTDSKFRTRFVPDPRLNFKNIRYIDSPDTINKYWMSGKYQAQVKLNDGYGAALVGMTGVALDKNYAPSLADQTTDKVTYVNLLGADGKPVLDPSTGKPLEIPETDDLKSGAFGTYVVKAVNPTTTQIMHNQLALANFVKGKQALSNASDQTNNDAKVETFSTFEHNFISEYLMHAIMSMKTDVIRDSAPLLNGMADPYHSELAFGTLGKNIINAINSGSGLTDNQKTDVASKFVEGDRYLVVDQDSFVKWVNNQENVSDFAISDNTFAANTMFGIGGDKATNLDGTFGNWLNTYVYYMQPNSENLNPYKSLFAESGNVLTSMQAIMQNMESVVVGASSATDPKVLSTIATALKDLATMGNDADAQPAVQALINAGYVTTLGPAIQSFVPTTAEQKTAFAKFNSQNNTDFKNGKDLLAFVKNKKNPSKVFLNVPDFFKDSSTGELTPFKHYDPTEGTTFVNDKYVAGKNPTTLFGFVSNMMRDENHGYENFFMYFPYLEQAAEQLMDMKNDSNITTDKTWMNIQDARQYVSINAIGDAYTQQIQTIATNGQNLSSLTKDMGTRGGKKIVYGVGLGIMMLFCGYFVGFTILRAIIKANKQYAKLTWSNWYISKFLLYVTVGFVQVTLAVWIIYAAGWHNYVSAGAMALDYVWMLESAIVILSVILGLQYAINPGIGAILAILYLALNVTSGGGSYPGWMESGFFHVVSWLTPFNYSIAGSDQIIFGIDIVGHNSVSTDFMLQCWGFLTCFFVFFFGIGFLGSRKCMRTAMYGTPSAKHIYNALIALGRPKQANAFRVAKKNKFDTVKTNSKGKPKYKYDWNTLSPLGDPKIAETSKALIRKKLVFNWYVESRKKRHLDEMELVTMINEDD